MDPRLARPSQPQTSRLDVAVLLAKGKLVGCLTTSQSKRSSLDASDINKFHDTLQIALKNSTHASKEFKKCVAWIVCHVARSRRRVLALGDYLVKLSQSYEPQVDGQREQDLASINVQARINFLHLLDAAFVRIRENPNHLLRKPNETYITFAQAVEPTVVSLFELAVPSQSVRAIYVHQALSDLLAHWKQDYLFTKRVRSTLRNIARKAYAEWLEWLHRNHSAYYSRLITTVSQKDLFAELPPTHGSVEDAWYDLPVGVMAQAIQSAKPGRPLGTSQLKPLDMPQGPVDPDLLASALEHVEECKRVTAVPNTPSVGEEEDFILNGLGLRVSRNNFDDSDKHELRLKEGYYGFSVPFMKVFEKISQNPPSGPERPPNWMPPPPQLYGAPPPFPPQNIPPPMRDAPYQGQSIGGGQPRYGDSGRGNSGGWRGGPGNWRGPPRGRGGGGGGGRGWGGGGYRPY